MYEKPQDDIQMERHGEKATTFSGKDSQPTYMELVDNRGELVSNEHGLVTDNVKGYFFRSTLQVIVIDLLYIGLVIVTLVTSFILVNAHLQRC